MTATKSPSRTQLVCHHKQAGLVFITKVGLARHPYQSACPPANILLNQLDVRCGIKCLDFVICNSQKALWFQWSVSVCQLQAVCVVCVIYTTANSLTKAWQSSRTTGVSKERPGTGCFLLICLVSYCGGFWFCGLSISDSKTDSCYHDAAGESAHKLLVWCTDRCTVQPAEQDVVRNATCCLPSQS